MSGYHFTEQGQDKAEKLGLPEFADKLSTEHFDYGADALSELLVKPFSGLNMGDEQDIDDAVTSTAKLLLPRSEEYRAFVRGLSIGGVGSWKMTDPLDEEDRLFPVPSHFAPVSKADEYVLSGIYGLQYRNRHALRSILSKEGYASADFKTRVEASAFVGAFILGALSEDYQSFITLTGVKEPNFSYDEGITEKTLVVTGSFHGDFRMSERTSLKSGAISPLGEEIDYSPIVRKDIAAYHSMEMELTVAMLEQALVVGGRDSLQCLYAEFVEKVSDDPGKGPRTSLFGDYGSSSAAYSMDVLQGLLEGENRSPRLVHSLPYLPQSDFFMEILLEDSGIILRNRDVRKDEVGNVITVKREHFKDFFGLLIDQANQGLGRTSVANHIEVLARTDALMSGEKFKEELY